MAAYLNPVCLCFFFFFNMYLFWAVLGLHCCIGFFLVAKVGATLGLLIAETSLVAEHGLWGAWASAAVACGFSSYHSWGLEHSLNWCGEWAEVL